MRHVRLLDGLDDDPVVNRVAELVDKMMEYQYRLSNGTFRMFRRKDAQRMEETVEKIRRHIGVLLGKVYPGGGYWEVTGVPDTRILLMCVDE